MADIYDTEMEELKELVKRQGAQMTDMQQTLHGMRNAQRRHFIYRILWWLVITGVGAYVYYTFVWPYISQILELYGGVAGYQEQIAEFFKNFRTQQ